MLVPPVTLVYYVNLKWNALYRCGQCFRPPSGFTDWTSKRLIFERPSFERPKFERFNFERLNLKRPNFERPNFERPNFEREPTYVARGGGDELLQSKTEQKSLWPFIRPLDHVASERKYVAFCMSIFKKCLLKILLTDLFWPICDRICWYDFMTVTEIQGAILKF